MTLTAVIALLALPPVGLSGLSAPAAGMEAPGETAGAATRAASPLALVLWVLLALVFSFLCSISEAVLLTLTPPFIAGLESRRPRLAGRLRRLKLENVDRSLAAILTLNTIAHTVGAIGAGAEATRLFGSAYFGAFSAVMTLLILFLSEIVPKTIGAVHWRALAAPTSWFVQTLILMLYPLILVSERLTRWIARGRTPHIFSRDEFAAMAELGQRAGGLRQDEHRIIRNLLVLEKTKAGDIMTPRSVIAALPEDLDIAGAAEALADLPFSRLPVHLGDLDRVTGFVLKDDVLLGQARGRPGVRLSELRRDMPTVPETISLPELLELLLRRRRSHIALVVDDYGVTQGLVTMEDVVESLLGQEIVDEVDRDVDMREVARELARRRRGRGRDGGGGEEPPPARAPTET